MSLPAFPMESVCKAAHMIFLGDSTLTSIFLVVFFSFQLTVIIRALLQKLKGKDRPLKDLLLRAVATHHGIHKHFHLLLEWEDKQSYLRKEGIWPPRFFPQLEEDLVSKILPIISISILRVRYMFYSEYAGEARRTARTYLVGCNLDLQAARFSVTLCLHQALLSSTV